MLHQICDRGSAENWPGLQPEFVDDSLAVTVPESVMLVGQYNNITTAYIINFLHYISNRESIQEQVISAHLTVFTDLGWGYQEILGKIKWKIYEKFRDLYKIYSFKKVSYTQKHIHGKQSTNKQK